jgi:creatinine amidohydrolase/Fe(II)-dependent formamide hydrolase-like protein
MQFPVERISFFSAMMYTFPAFNFAAAQAEKHVLNIVALIATETMMFGVTRHCLKFPGHPFCEDRRLSASLRNFLRGITNNCGFRLIGY